MNVQKTETHPDRTRINRIVFFGIAIVVIVLYILFMNQPIYGDAYGYGYSGARWMADNDLQPIPEGSGKGAYCMGHPAGFFWLWAILLNVLGDHVQVAHILPAIATFLALWGMYKLGRSMGSVLLGVLSSAALLSSPLFITQAFRPLPDVAMVAAITWSLYNYNRRRNIPAVIFCIIAVMMREQAVFLGAAYLLTELARSKFTKPKLLLLWCSPLLVIFINGLGNQFVNGFFIYSSYLGVPEPLPESWMGFRFWLFGGHLLAENYRWIPVVVSVALLLWKNCSKKIAIPLALGLAFLALSRSTWLPYLLSLAFVTLLAIFCRRKRPGDIWLVFIILVLLMILFHVFIVTISQDSQLDLLRYVLGAYPAVIAGSLSIICRLGGKKVLTIITAVFIAASLSTSFSMPYWNQPDTTLAVLQQQKGYVSAIGIAMEYGDTIIVPECELRTLRRPGLGYVDSVYPSRTVGRIWPALSETTDYTVLIPHYCRMDDVFMNELCIKMPSSSVLECMNDIREGEFTVEVYRITSTVQ